MRRLGRYLLLDEIASGGMASVHLGRLVADAGFARIVAIKRLHRHLARAPEFVAMFVDEARLAARIRHPNVAATLDVVSESGELFLVLEYVHGESLSRLWRMAAAAGGVPAEIATAIVAGALHGLHAAHEATSERGEPLGIVHRDVSPQNVMVGADGVPRVLDFGIAKAALRLASTRDGQLKGKVAYMAPEQIRGLPVDRRADVYAAAVILWELLTGQRLVETTDVGEAVTRIVQGKVERPSAITPAVVSALDEVVLRGLATEPGARFATAREMAVALEGVVRLASAREIGDWVAELAGSRLLARAARIAELEAQAPPTDEPTPAAPPDSEAPTEVSGRPLVVAPDAPAPPPTSALPSAPHASTSAPPSAPHASTSAPPSTSIARPPPRPSTLAIVATGAAAMAAGVLLLVRASTSHKPPPAAPPPLASASAAPASDGPAPIVPPESPPAAKAPRDDAASPEAAPLAPTPSVAAPAPPASSSPSVAPAPPHKVRAGGCNPPYYVTKDGTKRFKPECL